MIRRPSRAARGTLVSGLAGALIEAWAQVRIARLRVLLSLVGVAVAVAAMTFVIAFGGIMQQAQEDMEVQWSGRPGTVTVSVTPTLNRPGSASAGLSSDATAADPVAVGSMGMSGGEEGAQSGGLSADKQREMLAADIADFTTRYQIRSWDTSSTITGTTRLSLGGEPIKVDATVVSGGYGLLHSVNIVEGRWFSQDDLDDLSPAVVVSPGVLHTLGLDTLTGPVAVKGLTPVPMTYTIVGVEADQGTSIVCDPNGCSEQEQMSMKILDEPFLRAAGAHPPLSLPSFEVWAGAGRAADMTVLLREYFGGKYGVNAVVSYSNESGNQDRADSQRVFTLAVTGAGAAVMLLGALGLVNISLVTVRHRIHEIGVRRAFGATSRRVFFSIMLESVVATVAAGVVGIMLAIVVTRVMPWERVIGFPLSSIPAFPMSAAFIGLVTAAGVGALAGIIPAIVAVRIKPIDAIRF